LTVTTRTVSPYFFIKKRHGSGSDRSLVDSITVVSTGVVVDDVLVDDLFEPVQLSGP